MILYAGPVVALFTTYEDYAGCLIPRLQCHGFMGDHHNSCQPNKVSVNVCRTVMPLTIGNDLKIAVFTATGSTGGDVTWAHINDSILAAIDAYRIGKT